MKNIKRLTDINFKYLGDWLLKDKKLYHTIDDTSITNFLYAFVVNDDIKYIGKSTQSIKKRFSGYMTPGPSQSTNIKNNKNIKQELKNNNGIKIYIFKSDDMLKYGEFNINLAAGLEDILISTIKPIWNKK